LAAAAPNDTPFVIVQFGEAITSGATVASRIQDLGAGARALTQLPFVGVPATPEQVQTIATLPGVIQLSPNSQLYYLGAPGGLRALAALLDESVPTIKADQARTRYGVTGRGIGVAILDSGIDGLYPVDVQYPSRTIQNLKLT